MTYRPPGSAHYPVANWHRRVRSDPVSQGDEPLDYDG
jgi:hypothetical protein